MSKIAIDIGHARLSGARGVNGLEEHGQSVLTGQDLEACLTALGHDVTVIDYPDYGNRGDLNATVQAVNAGGYDMVVSLHMDASANTSARGAHVCYRSGNGKILAAAVAAQICPLLPGRAETTVHRTDLAIINQTRPPAILVELGFITNSHDTDYLLANRQYIARLLAAGIDNGLTKLLTAG